MITGIQTTGAPAHRSPYNYLRGIFPLSKWIKKQETGNGGKYRADVDVLVFARGLPAGYKGEQDVAAPRADAFGVSPCPTPALYGHTMQTSQKLCAFSTPLTSRSLSCLECAMETTNS